MDLRITIKDDLGNELDYITIYQYGSDSEGAENIRKMLSEVYEVEEDAVKSNGCSIDVDELIKLKMERNLYRDKLKTLKGELEKLVIRADIN
jgi:hypothetical protein